jgi:hypothetical protein
MDDLVLTIFSVFQQPKMATATPSSPLLPTPSALPQRYPARESTHQTSQP